jgi:hypothetical protein
MQGRDDGERREHADDDVDHREQQRSQQGGTCHDFSFVIYH